MANAKAGKLSPSDLLGRINKIAGRKVAHNLEEENPTDVIDWIPTGAKWLDAITCKGKWGGIPVGKITEIAGLEASPISGVCFRGNGTANGRLRR